MIRDSTMLRSPVSRGDRFRFWVLLALAPLLASCATVATPASPVGQTKPLATAASCSGVSVYPSPGTKTASPTTQISFRHISPAVISAGGVTVTGSVTGVHSGRWVADSDQDGASFYPTDKFAAGETVTVSAGHSICGAGGTSFQFVVAIPAGPLAKAPAASSTPTPALDQPTTTYASMPGVKVPKLKVTVPSSLGGGYVFESPQGGTKLGGPMIVNGKGQVVWFQPLPPEVVAADFKVQTYQGEPVLTYWQGMIINGHGIGEDIIMNSSYQVIRTIEPGNGYSADLHEFELSASGSTAWMTAFNTIGWNVKSDGGPKNGAVLDGIVQQVDVATGNVLFEWHSLDHVPLELSATAYAASTAYDYFHVNGIDPVGSGTVLISSRNTSTVYAVAKATGKVLWRLGGKQSSFKLGSGASFALQHNAEKHGPDQISIFDDEDSSPKDAPARAIVLHLDFKNRTATLERAYKHKGLLVPAQGNVQFLADGDVFVGWGSGSYTSEFSRNGKLLFDAYFGKTVTSYRAYLFDWVGTPTTPPSVATAKEAGGGLTVYASWNGSTQTRKWEVLGGPDAANLTPLATVKKSGFQTTVHLTAAPALVQVVAEDASGQPLSSSAVIAGG
ncbi:MAG: arylsulfotransferase family protein [Candidatus Dormiibacterota bacterium]